MTTEPVAVTVDAERFWCAEHAGQFFPPRGQGGELIVIGLTAEVYGYFALLPGIFDEAGGDAKELSSITSRHSPICCYVGGTSVLEWIAGTIGAGFSFFSLLAPAAINHQCRAAVWQVYGGAERCARRNGHRGPHQGPYPRGGPSASWPVTWRG